MQSFCNDGAAPAANLLCQCNCPLMREKAQHITEHYLRGIQATDVSHDATLCYRAAKFESYQMTPRNGNTSEVVRPHCQEACGAASCACGHRNCDIDRAMARDAYAWKHRTSEWMLERIVNDQLASKASTLQLTEESTRLQETLQLKQKEVTDLQVELENTKERAADHEETLDKLRLTADELRIRAETAEKEVEAKVAASSAQLSETVADLNAASSQACSLSLDNQMVRTELARLKHELQQKEQDYQATSEEMQLLEKKLKAAEAEVRKVKASVSFFQRELKTAASKIAEGESGLRENLVELKSVSSSANALSEEIDGLRERLAHVQAENGALNEQRARLEDENAELQAMLKTLKVEKQMSEDLLKEELQVMRAAVDDLEEQSDQKDSECEGYKIEIVEGEARLAAALAKEEEERLRAAVDFEKRLDRMTTLASDAIEAAEEKAALLERTIETLRDEMQSRGCELNTKVTELEEKLTEATESLEIEKRKSDELEATLKMERVLNTNMLRAERERSRALAQQLKERVRCLVDLCVAGAAEVVAKSERELEALNNEDDAKQETSHEAPFVQPQGKEISPDNGVHEAPMQAV